jgi:deoxycytidine triphosphate deaminase
MTNEFLHKDPFPEISQALLNSADIEDYVTKTKMVDPFDPKKLKSASYEVGFEGTVYYWDEHGEPVIENLNKEKTFKLPKNSIAFLFTKTKFRLPDYMAIRFNLKITHVHRGILLGTGPLVDPGFEGNLLIPLHNLTTNDYIFMVGEGLIWVEFTKLSENSKWTDCETGHGRVGTYREFPEDKKNKDPKYYFGKASMGKGIRSSIPDAMQATAEEAKKASTAAEAAKKSAKRFTFWGAVGVILAIMGLFVSIYLGYTPILQLVGDSVKYVKDENKYYETKIKNLSDEISLLKSQLDEIQAGMAIHKKNSAYEGLSTDSEVKTKNSKSMRPPRDDEIRVPNNSSRNKPE